MPWMFLILVVVLVAAFALVLSGRLPAVAQPTRQRFISGLPPRPTASEIDELRLPVVFRGYRMSDVDDALAVLRNRVAELEQAIVQPGHSPPPPTDAGQREPEAPGQSPFAAGG
jgi:DivIVA domain-containing protein